MPKRSFDDPDEPIVSKRQFSLVLRALYPQCPAYHRGLMMKRLARKAYRGRLLTIAAMVVDNWVRHSLTQYDQLIYAPGENALQRADARQVVASQVASIVASWQERSALQDPAYQAMRNGLIERRLKEGPSAALTMAENIAIVEELTLWLQRHGEPVGRAPTPKSHPQSTSTDPTRTSKS